MIGSFTLIKNEAFWIGAHLLSWLPVLDQMVFFDGNSTDGTLDIIKHVQATHPLSHKIKLVEGKDPVDLRDDYVRLFNECLWAVDTELAIFIHPDMLCLNPGNIRKLDEAIAGSVRVRSFGGEPDGSWYEAKGRDNVWKNIYRLRDPDLGAHYYGHYGVWNEDVYFSEITGTEHAHHGGDVGKYPYEVVDSGCEIAHFSDVRPYARRLERMVRCLTNQGKTDVLETAKKHARVTLTNGDGITWSSAPPELASGIRAAQSKFKEAVRA